MPHEDLQKTKPLFPASTPQEEQHPELSIPGKNEKAKSRPSFDLLTAELFPQSPAMSAPKKKPQGEPKEGDFAQLISLPKKI